jgi:hypothetical protein
MAHFKPGAEIGTDGKLILHVPSVNEGVVAARNSIEGHGRRLRAELPDVRLQL